MCAMAFEDSPSQKLFTDATLTQGAWINDDGVTSVFSVPAEYQHSSFESEYYSVHRAILENGMPNMQINLHCDHRGLCDTLKRRAMRHPVKHARLNVLFEALMSFMESNNIQLKVSWIPSKLNPADELSRSEPDLGDWPSDEPSRSEPDLGDWLSDELSGSEPDLGDWPSGEPSRSEPDLGDWLSDELSGSEPDLGDWPSDEPSRSEPDLGDWESDELPRPEPGYGDWTWDD
ncbi:hypothetical protein BGX21_008495 [Mortierella sp. AD011]|nr:hypothetical protein BGX20_004795 [Mortierella sp. AD010]KAF9397794.1 hypothetical protein BGX21_008495 [Mortierella sp. AD011]